MSDQEEKGARRSLLRIKGGAKKTRRSRKSDQDKIAKWYKKFPLGMALFDAAGGVDPASDGTEFLAKVNTTLVAALLARGAPPNFTGPGRYTPLHFAATRGDVDVCMLLLKAGADVNATNRWDWTPLHCAATSGNTDVVELLVEKGADLYATTVHCNTPLDEATGMQHWVTSAKLKRLMGPDWFEHARKSYHQDPEGKYIYDRMETITDDEIALYWQSLNREAEGNDGLRQFLERLNATNDDELGKQIEIEPELRDQVGWVDDKGEYHFPERRYAKAKADIVGGGGGMSGSTDSDIVSSDDERLLPKTGQEGDGDVDGVSLGSFEETDEAVIDAGEGVNERGREG